MNAPHELSLAVDCVVFGIDEAGLKVLLIRRGIEPFRGRWALPGGFVHLDESVDAAARRELREEAGLTKAFLEQLYTFGDPRRDPRKRVVTVAYYALVALRDESLQAGTDAERAAWFEVTDLPRLAFDHQTIFETALTRLKGKVRYQPVGFELLPEKFTLSALQHLYESVLERTLDKRNFRKKLLQLDILEETDDFEEDVAHRAARLYRFDRQKYQRHLARGLTFEL